MPASRDHSSSGTLQCTALQLAEQGSLQMITDFAFSKNENLEIDWCRNVRDTINYDTDLISKLSYAAVHWSPKLFDLTLSTTTFYKNIWNISCTKTIQPQF